MIMGWLGSWDLYQGDPTLGGCREGIIKELFID